jgi:hypothetical protein
MSNKDVGCACQAICKPISCSPIQQPVLRWPLKSSGVQKHKERHSVHWLLLGSWVFQTAPSGGMLWPGLWNQCLLVRLCKIWCELHNTTTNSSVKNQGTADQACWIHSLNVTICTLRSLPSASWKESTLSLFEAILNLCSGPSPVCLTLHSLLQTLFPDFWACLLLLRA